MALSVATVGPRWDITAVEGAIEEE